MGHDTRTASMTTSSFAATTFFATSPARSLALVAQVRPTLTRLLL